ncbi:tyrosine-type recombinase/integrase [Methylobacterium radiodurans]|uniref:Integrase n=1 Tax=Methylobacterium radiodurans TaxID=2202828 RepID=A0A2U8VRW2_9HYPH|nr:site-specific integrase [Methylobacterium radiodurans]AWN36519.1 integrase [Methylobacterium radiodurans]
MRKTDDDAYTIGRLRTDEFPRGECVLIFRQDGKRRRFRLGTDNEAEARRRAPTIYAEAVKPKGSSVGELWQAYRLEKAGKPSVAIMEHQWKALGPHFGRMNAEDITIDDCNAYAAARRAIGRKDGTILTELNRVRTVLNWAHKRRLIRVSPHIERPSAPKSKTEHLTRDQVRALLKACSMPHLQLFVYLAYATAGRAGAILDLTWDRIDFARGKIDLENPDIRVPHKGRAVVPMNRTLRMRLLEAKQGARSDYVVEWGGQKVGSVKRGLAKAAENAGLPHVHPHMLRHSAAVRQAEEGVPMEEIASFLGHSNVNVTRRIYARFSPHHLLKSAAALELDDFDLTEVKRTA